MCTYTAICFKVIKIKHPTSFRFWYICPSKSMIHSVSHYDSNRSTLVQNYSHIQAIFLHVFRLVSLERQYTPLLLRSLTVLGWRRPVTDMAQHPLTNLPIRCHLATQLSSGPIKATNPSKLELVQSQTLSLLFFNRRYSSQLSHPSYSNCSSVLTNEHKRQALKFLWSLGTVSSDIFRQFVPIAYF